MIRHIPVSHAAIMTNTEPVFGFLFGYVLFSDLPTTGQFIGAGLIVMAVVTTGNLSPPAKIAEQPAVLN